MDRENIEDVMALTSLQEGMLFHYLKNPSGDVYFGQLSLGISGIVDIKRFEQAWTMVTAANQMLRTIFRWEKMSNPTQVVLKTHKPRLNYYDFFTGNPGEAEKRLEELKKRDRKETFDLREVPFRVTLCRITENEYELVISNHHILYDGWSTGIILTEFFNAYNDLTAGKVPALPAKTSFKEFVRWNQRQDVKKQEIFWGEYLNGVDWDNRIGIPVKKRKPGDGGSSVFPVTFAAGKKDCLEKFVKKHKITSASFLYAAWGLLLQKYTNNSDVILGTTVSGRSGGLKGIEDIVGLFINTIPLRAAAGTGRSLLELLLRLNGELQAREAFENTPLVKIKEYSGCKGKEELFDSIVVIENYPLDIRRLRRSGALDIRSYSMVEAAHYDLSVVIRVSGGISIDFMYRESVFDEADIQRLGTHFTGIVREILENPGQTVEELDILSAGERRGILEDFNATATDYPRDKTVHQLFREQAGRTPDNIVLIGETDEKHKNVHCLSYRELYNEALRTAGLLKERGVGAGDIVALMARRSIEMVIGILGILNAGGAYMPMDPDYPEERVNYMLNDSGAKVLLKNSEIRNKVNVPVVLDFENSDLSPSGLAYIIYTSGSTGNPKGVMAEHRNVVRLVKNTDFIDFFHKDRFLQTGALEFDASTLEIWGPLLNGAGLVLVDKGTILDNRRLKEAVKRHFISLMWLTSPLFNQVSDIGVFEGLRCLLVGGDVLSPPHINRVRKAFPHLKVINGYGPTENTTFSTTYVIGGRDSDENSRVKFPIGRPIANSTVYIVDAYGHLVPVGVPGELLVGGDGVSRGYLNNPELTADKFSRGAAPSTTLYRTGDLARWLPDGNIEFLGRMDHQVKIRGFRIEPEEIQYHLLKYRDVEDAVVIARPGETGDNHLCAYAAGSPEALRISDLRDFLAGRLPAYMVPTYFVILEKLPLNANGKLDRQALPLPEIVSGAGYRPPRDELEELLIGVWSEVLGIDALRIGIDDDFFRLGGHSLSATRLLARIHKVLDRDISIVEFFENPTVRGLSDFIARAAGSREGESLYAPVTPAEKRDFYMLSSAQKRLYVLQQMDPANTAYNIPYIIVLEGGVKKGALAAVFRKIFRRHESLRTSFQSAVNVDGIGEEVVQVIHEHVDFEIETHHAEGTPPPLYPAALLPLLTGFIRPFDLSRAPLIRVKLIKAGETESGHLLLMDIHHIIADGVSETLLLSELAALYAGEVLSPLKLQYKDYSQWHRHRAKKTGYRRQEAFWLNQFRGDIPRLNMPIDFPRPAVRDFEGNVKGFSLSPGESRRLRETARGEGVTVFMFLLAVYYVFLSKISHQQDIVVGVPAAGRTHPDLYNIIGMFVNTLALRNRVPVEKTFREFLQTIKNRTLEAFESQLYQFEDLVEKVLDERDAGRNPLFDVMFTSNNWGEPPGKTREKRETWENEINKLDPEHMEYKTSRFDLILHSLEREDTVGFLFEYAAKLYKKETIERFALYYKKILALVAGDPGKKISGLEIVSENERKKLLRNFKEEHGNIITEHVKRNKSRDPSTGATGAPLAADFDL